ncbi:MAG: DUF3809 domain-containing protein [Deinococcaceae bacterium]
MKLEFKEDFEIPVSISTPQAIAYLQNPSKSLRHVQFIRDLKQTETHITATLAFVVPMLGEFRFPFTSTLTRTETGAHLQPQPPSTTSTSWAEVGGTGSAQDGKLHYRLEVVIHIHMPAAEKWGGLAFEKMARATAQKNLEKVIQEFPQGILDGLGAKLN